MYAELPVTWASNLQTEVALSNTKEESITMSEYLRMVTPSMSLMEDDRKKSWNIQQRTKTHCKIFKDNVQTNVTMPKSRRSTEYIFVKCWHFREHLEQEKYPFTQYQLKIK